MYYYLIIAIIITIIVIIMRADTCPLGSKTYFMGFVALHSWNGGGRSLIDLVIQKAVGRLNQSFVSDPNQQESGGCIPTEQQICFIQWFMGSSVKDLIEFLRPMDFPHNPLCKDHPKIVRSCFNIKCLVLRSVCLPSHLGFRSWHGFVQRLIPRILSRLYHWQRDK